VRRRLFDRTGDMAAVQATARAFGDLYRANPTRFPGEAQAARYEERIVSAYPIHPEVFDRLYEDWSTLDKFQRTRGVLQYMAIVIHRLWNNGDRDALIMPGSLPLDDATVRNKSIHYLPTGWEPVIEREIDGPRSTAADIDGHDTRFGSVQAARRCARAIFLGSAPSNAAQNVRGIRMEGILLGAVQPGQAVGTFEDAVERARKLAGIDDANLVSYDPPLSFGSLFRLLGQANAEARTVRIDVGLGHGNPLPHGRLYFVSPVHLR